MYVVSARVQRLDHRKGVKTQEIRGRTTYRDGSITVRSQITSFWGHPPRVEVSTGEKGPASHWVRHVSRPSVVEDKG